MALIHHQQCVFRQVFEQGGRRLAGIAAGQIARIVLDPFAGTGGLHHLDVEVGALGQPLDLQQLALGGKLRHALLQFGLDLDDRLRQRRARGHVMAVGIDGDTLQRRGLFSGQRVEFVDRLDLVAEQRNPPGTVLVMAGVDVDDLAAQPEAAAHEGGVVAAVLQVHQALGQLVAVDGPADLQLHHHLGVGLDRADAVDAGHRGNDDHVVALQQRLRGGMAHPVDLLVDLGVLLYVRVGPRHIGFGLVVVVVADEILHRVVGEEGFHLGIELGRQGLVRRQHQRGFLHRLDHLRHGEGLARAGDAEQHLIDLALVHTGDEFGDRGRLIAGGLVLGDDLQPVGNRPDRLPYRHKQPAGRQVGGADQRLRHKRLPRIPRYGAVAGAMPAPNRCAAWHSTPVERTSRNRLAPRTMRQNPTGRDDPFPGGPGDHIFTAISPPFLPPRPTCHGAGQRPSSPLPPLWGRGQGEGEAASLPAATCTP